MNPDPAAWQQLLTSPLFMLTLTLVAFQGCLWLYQRCRQFPLLHPTVIGAMVVASSLWLLDIDYASYARGAWWLELLLGPATVALAIPLYQQLPLIRQLALPIIATTLVGATVGAASAVAFAWLFGGSPETLLSVAPKSVTTPIAIGISQELGGLIGLTTGAVMITAATGISLAPLVFRWLGVDDVRVQGFVLGVASHGMGAARAFETSSTGGAFASLALCLVGILSAIAIPLLGSLLPG
jgi:predicted murein hydrolase (TIGR00659 family)